MKLSNKISIILLIAIAAGMTAGSIAVYHYLCGVAAHRIILILFLPAVLILLAAAIMFIAKKLVLPIEKLTALAHLISNGDLSQRIKLTSNDEIGLLGDAFNIMAERLVRLQEQMKNYTADIEVKVGERTKELKKTEEALRLSKAGFYNIVEQSADGVVIIDFAGIVRYVNSATQSLLGCREKDILEKQFAFPITRNSSVELNIVRHNREPKVAEMRVVETQWNGGKVWLAMLRDITERKKMEKKLKETMAIKAEFTSMVSHELRTPLTAIKEGLALVLDGMVGQINDEQKELLGISKKNVDRLTRLINEVLDFQKLECGKMKFNIKPNNINDTAKDAYEIMLPVAKEKNVSIQLNTDDNLPVVAFDRNKITQVLLNLINNAVKFTDEGTITIKTGQDDFSVLVSIADNGCGIKEKDLPRLFSRFEQLNTGGERRTGGTGLGLAISKEIIEQHKGAIWAESVAGKGSTFTFRLPKHSDAELSEKSTSNTVSEKAPQDGRLAVHTYRLHSDKE